MPSPGKSAKAATEHVAASGGAQLEHLARQAAVGEAPAPFAYAFKCLGFVVKLSVAPDPDSEADAAAAITTPAAAGANPTPSRA